jgi:hypothetical protein
MARPSKDSYIISKIDSIIGSQIATKDLAVFCECSYPTIINFLKSYPERFQKVSHGIYKIVESSKDQQFEVNTISDQHLKVSSVSESDYVDPIIKFVAQEFDW